MIKLKKRIKKSKQKLTVLDPQHHVIDDLQQQVQIALQAIQNYFKGKKRPAPWTLLLGMQGAGKTSLLAHSHIKLTSPLQKSIDNVGATKTIDWWISDEAVFVDPSGKYCLATQNETQQQQYWHSFLQAIAAHRQPLPLFDKVCFVVDLPSLIYPDDPTFNDLIARWQEQVHILAQLSGGLAIDIIITQCDHIAGFAEFFANLRSDEQEQVVGFSLTNQEEKYVNERLQDSFKLFLQIINHRLLDRLHHEPNLERRQRVNEFTLQLERLFKPLQKIIGSLPDSPQIRVNHVFFGSCQQTMTPTNMIAPDVEKAFHIKTNQSKPLVAEQKSLFIGQLFRPTDIVKTMASDKGKKWWPIATYPAAFAGLLVAAVVFHHSYQENRLALHNLRQNSVILAANEPKWLTNLNTLYQMQQQLNSKTAGKSHGIGYSELKELQTTIDRQYQETLRRHFLNYMQQSIASSVTQDTNNNSSALYNALQAYLMLTMPEKLKSDFINDWFNTYWQHEFPQNSALQNQLAIYLQDALRLPQAKWQSNPSLIKQAQVVLQQQPLAEIAFKMLVDGNDLHLVPLTKQTFTGIDLTHAKIAGFYSMDNFIPVYKDKIPNLVKSFNKGNWVIGKPNTQNMDSKQLTQEVRDIYLQHYLQEWQNSLNQISFVEPQSFTDADTQINLLLNAQSPLWQLYQNALKVAKNAGAQVPEDGLMNYMPDQPTAKTMVQALSHLRDYLKSIKDAPSSIKAAFDKSAARFQTNGADDAITQTISAADKMPAPIQQWMRTISHNSWKLMLSNAKTYLNTIWQTHVLPSYEKTIKNRYPVFSLAINDIQINDFNQFFGPGGIIQDYFNNYLKNFVDLSQVYWSWKKLDGEQLDIAQSNLDMLIRASMIQKMFYVDDHSKPLFRFKLMPVDLSQDANQFVLNIGGQMVRYTPGNKAPTTISWPGPDGPFVTMRFNSPSDNNPTTTTMGPWAWLRLVDQYATLKSSSDPRSFQITFNLTNKKATYQLTADNPINPFLPNVLSGFRAPDGF